MFLAIIKCDSYIIAKDFITFAFAKECENAGLTVIRVK